MTTEELLNLISQTLQIDRAAVTTDSRATDFSEAWDSVGTMNLLLAVSDLGVQLAPGQAERFQSVEGIIGVLRDAGQLE